MKEPFQWSLHINSPYTYTKCHRVLTGTWLTSTHTDFKVSFLKIQNRKIFIKYTNQ